MSDGKRFDLNGDLDNILNDVQAATESEQRRQAQNKDKTTGDARDKSKTMSMALIAMGVVAVLFLGYWLVFGRSNEEAGGVYTPPANQTRQTQQPTAQKKKIEVTRTPSTPPTTPSAPSRSGSRPPQGYDQPMDDPGM